MQVCICVATPFALVACNKANFLVTDTPVSLLRALESSAYEFGGVFRKRILPMLPRHLVHMLNWREVELKRLVTNLVLFASLVDIVEKILSRNVGKRAICNWMLLPATNAPKFLNYALFPDCKFIDVSL